jgi:RNA-directed DNA polymerase
MKRIGNLYNRIISMDNLILADQRASKGKGRQKGVREHFLNRDENLLMLQGMLENGSFQTSAYKTFIIFEPKRRIIYRLPYFPDRIVHHAIMNVLEPIWVAFFTADTYSCIKGRGIHSAGRKINKVLKNVPDTQFCLKLDIEKFYPSVDHAILKQIIRIKLKDPRLLTLLDQIIDSADGLPIGNYLSQFLANVYLSYFDHWLKEVMKVKYYFRYCDDLVIFADNKPYLHQLLADIRLYLEVDLHLRVKNNYQIFPVDSRGVDFLGYVFYHTHSRLRKSIKQNFAKAVAQRKGKASLAAYYGWAIHVNSKNLLKKLCYGNYKEVQGYGYQQTGSRIPGRQDVCLPGVKPGDSHQRLQSGIIEIPATR